MDKVIFQKPDTVLLSRLGFTCVDMHCHSIHSDSSNRVKDLLTKATKRNFGLALTDHNAIGGCVDACSRIKEALVIPGIEVSSKEGPHMLVYFYNVSELKEFYAKSIQNCKSRNPYLETTVPMDELLAASKRYNCFLSAAHPYGTGFQGIQKSILNNDMPRSVLDRIDCIEVICGNDSHSRNVKAARLAEVLKKPFTAGSDGHRLAAVGSCVVVAQANTVEGFLDAVKAGKAYAIGKEARMISRFSATTIRKHLRYFRGTTSSLNTMLRRNISYYKPLGGIKQRIIRKLKVHRH